MTKNIRGRFTLQSIEQHATADKNACHCNVRFTAVTSDMADCASWSQWTPTGELKMTITNPDAMDALVVGRQYYLDLSPVE